MQKSSDTRIVQSDFKNAVNQLEHYLDNASFEITRKEIKESEAYIVAENKTTSFFKLFWTAKPQMTYWHIKQQATNEVKIKVKVTSFRIFQLYFYGVVLFLLSFASMFLKASTSSGPGESLNAYFIFFMLFVSACCLFLWLIRTKPYALFFDGYYRYLYKTTLKKEQAIQLHPSFPEIVPGFMIFIVFSVIYFCNTNIFSALTGILGGLILFIGFVIMLLTIALLYREKSVKMLFLLIAIYFCIPTAVYSNLPMITSVTKQISNIVRQLVENTKLLEKRLKEDTEFAQHFSAKGNALKNEMHNFAVILAVLYAIILAVLLLIFVSMTYLPVEILRRIEHFSTNRKESLYFQGMKQDNMLNPFNCCVIGIWLLLGLANLLGFVFSVAILGRVFGCDNFIIKSDISDLFFDSSRMMFSYLLPENRSTNVVHVLVMLIYALPMPLLYMLVILKNIKFSLKITLFLKASHNETASMEFRTKIKKLCRDCGIAPPVIRITNSAQISEGASYLGFPVFRNMLVIRKKTIEALSINEHALDAYLVHEIYHLKKHTFLWRILCLLSDFTLFGNGFLAILQSSYEVELAADSYAVNWLLQHEISPEYLIAALKSQEKLKEQEYFGLLLSNLSFTGSIENGEYRERIIRQSDASGRIKKALINLKLLCQMYFGNYIMSYIHPDNEYRIERIKENYSGTE
jgi:hypothetical protein